MAPPKISWPISSPLKIVDVGAMWLGEGFEPYARLMKVQSCKIIGFEPLEAECARLQAMNRPGHTYLPYFIGDGTAQTFYECNRGYTSSLLEPDLALTSRFQNLAELMQVIRTHPVQTARLDDIPETEGVDYLKVDVQGGELLVLQGAEARLKDALVVHTEVEFLPLYKNQPLFTDIDAHMRGRGFVLHKFSDVFGRAFKPVIAQNNPNAPLSQILWGDAVYVRDFRSFDTMDPAALYKLAIILHENYESVDLAAVALDAYDRKMGTAYMADYLRELTTPAR